MSLTISPQLLEQAQHGPVDERAFVAAIRDSLPYVWETISEVAETARAGDAGFGDNVVPPPDEAARGQLLRALASDAIRGALERHFQVRLAFQNCHRVAAFRPGAEHADAYRAFTSSRAQILNQTPELRDC